MELCRHLILCLCMTVFAANLLSAQFELPLTLDFKDGTESVDLGTAYYVGQHTMEPVEVRHPDVVDMDGPNAQIGDGYSWVFPKEGTITWDPSQHRYVQAWIPYLHRSDIAGIQWSINGGAFQGDLWASRINNPHQYFHTKPTLVDFNALHGQTSPFEVRFRFAVVNTQYGKDDDLTETGATIDWIKLGLPASANIDIAKWSTEWPAASGDATPHVCGFVGPEHGAVAENPPTLEWTPPEGFTNLTYIVSLSQHPHFRGATTRTVHGVPTTQYTPPEPLDEGTWYWVVIPVNSDGICGNNSYKDLVPGGSWNTPTNYNYYSFRIIGPNRATGWAVFE